MKDEIPLLLEQARNKCLVGIANVGSTESAKTVWCAAMRATIEKMCTPRFLNALDRQKDVIRNSTSAILRKALGDGADRSFASGLHDWDSDWRHLWPIRREQIRQGFCAAIEQQVAMSVDSASNAAIQAATTICFHGSDWDDTWHQLNQVCDQRSFSSYFIKGDFFPDNFASTGGLAGDEPLAKVKTAKYSFASTLSSGSGPFLEFNKIDGIALVKKLVECRKQMHARFEALCNALLDKVSHERLMFETSVFRIIEGDGDQRLVEALRLVEHLESDPRRRQTVKDWADQISELGGQRSRLHFVPLPS